MAREWPVVGRTSASGCEFGGGGCSGGRCARLSRPRGRPPWWRVPQALHLPRLSPIGGSWDCVVPPFAELGSPSHSLPLFTDGGDEKPPRSPGSPPGLSLHLLPALTGGLRLGDDLENERGLLSSLRPHRGPSAEQKVEGCRRSSLNPVLGHPQYLAGVSRGGGRLGDDRLLPFLNAVSSGSGPGFCDQINNLYFVCLGYDSCPRCPGVYAGSVHAAPPSGLHQYHAEQEAALPFSPPCLRGRGWGDPLRPVS